MILEVGTNPFFRNVLPSGDGFECQALPNGPPILFQKLLRGQAEVPELPGCAADGASYLETLANLERVIDEWIETARELGRPIPEPKGRLMYA